MTVYIGSIANQKNYQNGCHFKNTIRITKYLMCIYRGHMRICIPRIKFLCLTLCQGEVYTDDDNDDDANDDGQFTIVFGSFVDKPNEPTKGIFNEVTKSFSG